MDIQIITGVAASMCMALSLVPQLVKVIRTQKAEDVSYLMLAVILAGSVLWIMYGIMRNDWIIIGSNILSILINTTTFFFSIKYRGNK